MHSTLRIAQMTQYNRRLRTQHQLLPRECTSDYPHPMQNPMYDLHMLPHEPPNPLIPLYRLICPILFYVPRRRPSNRNIICIWNGVFRNFVLQSESDISLHDLKGICPPHRNCCQSESPQWRREGRQVPRTHIQPPLIKCYEEVQCSVAGPTPEALCYLLRVRGNRRISDSYSV